MSLSVVLESKSLELHCPFQMLTGDETVTSGEAYVGGHSILSELDQAQQNLGAYRI